MAKWLQYLRYLSDMKCIYHYLGVTNLNPGLVELGVCDTVLFKWYSNQKQTTRPKVLMLEPGPSASITLDEKMNKM